MYQCLCCELFGFMFVYCLISCKSRMLIFYSFLIPFLSIIRFDSLLNCKIFDSYGLMRVYTLFCITFIITLMKEDRILNISFNKIHNFIFNNNKTSKLYSFRLTQYFRYLHSIQKKSIDFIFYFRNWVIPVDSIQLCM